MINFELLTKTRATIYKKTKQIFNHEIWKEKVLVDKMRLPRNIYMWNNKSLNKLSFS